MKLWLICYADEGRYALNHIIQLQWMTCHSARELGGFDEIIPFRRSHISKQFIADNGEVFNNTRGAGYWIWKSYLALEMLKSPEVAKDDIVLYCDSKIVFTGPVKPLIDVFQRDNLSVMTFRQIAPSKPYTKRDCFVLTGTDEPKYVETTQRVGGFWIFKKDDFSQQFFTTMMGYHRDPRIITDIPSQAPNYPEFIEHRHCESLISVLAKKNNLYPYRFPYAKHSKVEQDATQGFFTDESYQEYVKRGEPQGKRPYITTFRQYPDIVTDDKSSYGDMIDY